MFKPGAPGAPARGQCAAPESPPPSACSISSQNLSSSSSVCITTPFSFQYPNELPETRFYQPISVF